MSDPIRLLLWPSRLLLLGPAFGTELHRHHAVQLCVGLEAPLNLRAAAEAPWRSAVGFVVGSDQPHEFAAAAGPSALLYLDAESADGRALRAGAQGLAPLTVAPPLRRALHAAWRDGVAPAPARQLCRQLLGTPAAPSVAVDAPVQAAVDWIAAHLAQTIRSAELAAAVGWSESHFAHRFRAQTGLPLRRYVLWRRLRAAAEAALRGDSLTAAAHAAGFADSAHLSRTFRETFGVTPSFLFAQRDRLDIRVFDRDDADTSISDGPRA